MGHSALSARGKLGAITRRFPNEPDRLTEARRNLAAAKLQDYIERTLADAPPLTDWTVPGSPDTRCGCPS
jgi:hypothetical protein